MGGRIYLVEDEKNLNLLLGKYLELEGYEVTSFFSGLPALERIKEQPELWILDIMLPDIDGYQLVKSIKEWNENTPVIFISARNEELDRVVGLELGSDDYLSKPFLPRELVIRTNKLLGRVRQKERNTKLYEQNIDGCILDRRTRTVLYENVEVQLTVKEYDLFVYFVENKNTVVSREQILIKVWGSEYFGSDRVVDDTVRRLRKKLCSLNIETLYGYGYKLVVKE